MKRITIVAILGIALLCLCGCKEEANQSKPLPLTVEGDEITKAAIEHMLKTNPRIYIPRSNTSVPGSDTEYAIQIVKPDPGKNYSILRVEPDPNTEYSMMIIDPRTQKPPTDIDPNALKAIIDQLKKRKQNAIEE